MGEAEEWLRARGVVKLNLMVRAENAGVLAFYRRLGYADDDVIVMARRLVEERG